MQPDGSSSCSTSSSSRTTYTCSTCWAGVGAFIAAAQQLQELVLSDASLGDEGTRQLGEGLAAAAGSSAAATAAGPGAQLGAAQDSCQPGSAAEGYLECCSSGSKGTQFSLESLDVSSNCIGVQGVRALGRGLALACPGLKTLKLGSNQLSAEGVSSLVKGLQAAAAAAAEVPAAVTGVGGSPGATCGCCLSELDLSGNGISGEAEVQRSTPPIFVR
jgi:Ran GTPase-activating protein (RanGAP) involved in mRNA processing and transport